MISIEQIRQIQKKRKSLNKITEFKMLGKEVCDEHDLTVPQSLDILNGRYDDVLKVLKGIDKDSEGNLYYTMSNGIVVTLNH